jgi:hypothetical protein
MGRRSYGRPYGGGCGGAELARTAGGRGSATAIVAARGLELDPRSNDRAGLGLLVALAVAATVGFLMLLLGPLTDRALGPEFVGLTPEGRRRSHET